MSSSELSEWMALRNLEYQERREAEMKAKAQAKVQQQRGSRGYRR